MLHTLSRGVLSCWHGPPAYIADHLIYFGFMLQEKWPHHMPVQNLRTIPGDGSHAPQQEQALNTRKKETKHAHTQKKGKEVKSGLWELITNIEQRRVVPTKKTEVADSYKSLSNLTITICVWSQVLSLSYMHTVVSSPVMQHAQTNDESIVSREL